MKINSLWCPKCNKRGLNFYDKDRLRPDKVDDITHVWCLYCGYINNSTNKKKKAFIEIKEAEGK